MSRSKSKWITHREGDDETEYALRFLLLLLLAFALDVLPLPAAVAAAFVLIAFNTRIPNVRAYNLQMRSCYSRVCWGLQGSQGTELAGTSTPTITGWPSFLKAIRSMPSCCHHARRPGKADGLPWLFGRPSTARAKLLNSHD